jgi:hypothetical protein
VRIPFLIDEDAPMSVGRFLAARNHDVQYMCILKPGALDPEVLALAHSSRAIIVSKNKKHFHKLNPRRPAARTIHAGCLYLCCEESQMLRRIEQCIDLVEYEWQSRQRMGDGRVLMEIRIDLVRIHR